MRNLRYFLLVLSILGCSSSSVNNVRSLIISDSLAYYSDDDLAVKIPAGVSNAGHGPTLRRQVMPTYPEVASERHLEGEVQLKALVTTDGTVKRAKVWKSTDTLFNRPSLIAGMQWTFAPANDSGVNKDVWILIPFRFHLK